MLWSLGETDSEIFNFSVLLILSFIINILFFCLTSISTKWSTAGNISSGKDHTFNASDTPEIEKLDADICTKKVLAERLNTPDTFVQYARLQREINAQERMLESMKVEAMSKKQSPISQPILNNGADINSLLGFICPSLRPPNLCQKENSKKCGIFQKIIHSPVVPTVLLYLVVRTLLPKDISQVIGWTRIASASLISKFAVQRLKTIGGDFLRYCVTAWNGIFNYSIKDKQH